jgi:assimilatory nitrate reductase catalytic subunit
VDLAARLVGQTNLFQHKDKLHMSYTSAKEIWEEHRESTRGRDLDITGLSYKHLDQKPEQWPMREGAERGQARLYTDGVFATLNGLAKFAALPYADTAEVRDTRYPFSLNTGRLRDHWHSMTRTGLLGKLFGHVPEPVVQLNPDDMIQLGLEEGMLVHVTSKRGSIVLPVQASSNLGVSQAFIPMHWGAAFLSGRDHQNKPLTGVNALTTSAYCPLSKQPELKHAAVKVLKSDLPWTMLAMAWMPEHKLQSILKALRTHLSQFEFASCVPFGETHSDGVIREGILIRAASSEVPDLQILLDIEQLLELKGAENLRYIDSKRCQIRSISLQSDINHHHNDKRLRAFLIAGDTTSETWLKALLQTHASTQSYGRRLLMTGRKPPMELVNEGNTVCSCLGVKELSIHHHLKLKKGDKSQLLYSLQSELKCGTQCGSCVPELRRIIDITESFI